MQRVRYDGGLEGKGIAASQKDILSEKYIGIVVVDRVTDSVVFQCDRVAVTSQKWSVKSKGILEGSFSFEAIDIKNETEIS